MRFPSLLIGIEHIIFSRIFGKIVKEFFPTFFFENKKKYFEKNLTM